MNRVGLANSQTALRSPPEVEAGLLSTIRFPLSGIDITIWAQRTLQAISDVSCNQLGDGASLIDDRGRATVEVFDRDL